jgi:hypothetical protein
MQHEFREFLESLDNPTKKLPTGRLGMIAIRCAVVAQILRKSLHDWEYAEEHLFIESCMQLTADYGDFYTELFDKVEGNAASILAASSLELRHQVQKLAGCFSALSRGDKDPMLAHMVRAFAKAAQELVDEHLGRAQSAPPKAPPPTVVPIAPNVYSLTMYRAAKK